MTQLIECNLGIQFVACPLIDPFCNELGAQRLGGP
jgi:hypothetical protein